MTKRNKLIKPLLYIVLISSLASCGTGDSFSIDLTKFSSYQENEYCRTNIEALAQSKYPAIGRIKQVQPFAKLSDGTYSSEGIAPVYPFDTNLIYTLYSAKDLKDANDVMAIESITGKYTFDMHKLFDRHYYYLDENNQLINNLKVINDNYGNGWIKVDNDLFNVLKVAVEVTKLSNGKFNLFIGELSDYWDKYINEINSNWDFSDETLDPAQTQSGKDEVAKLVAETPAANEIDSVLEFNQNTSEIKFNKYKNAERVSISLGGIGKGYLTEQIYQKLKAQGYTKGASYAGSSSIVVMDKRSYKDKWTISLSNPYGIFYSPIGKLKFNEKMSISTSGAQVNYYYAIVDGKEVLRHHIIDASTGYPNDYYNQVTLISKKIPSSIMDTLSTVLINCNESEIETYIKAFRTNYKADLECVLYKKNYQSEKRSVDVTITKGLKNKIFIEQEDDGSKTYIPCNYKYLGY